jgi:hypothetical protein
MLAVQLEIVGAWAAGPDGSGWQDSDLKIENFVNWLNPIQTVFPLDSGPALIQLTMIERAAMGADLGEAVAHLNQSIASFNGFRAKIEAMQVTNVVGLARIWYAVRAALAERLKEQFPSSAEGRVDLLRVAKLQNDDALLAQVVGNSLVNLHVGLIGTEGSHGLHDAWRCARKALDADRGL